MALDKDPAPATLTVGSPARLRAAPMAAVLIVLVLAALGGVSAVLVPELGLDGHTAFATVFFYLFARNEPLMLWVLGAFAALAGVLAMVAKRGGGVSVAEWADDVSPFRMRSMMSATGREVCQSPPGQATTKLSMSREMTEPGLVMITPAMRPGRGL